MRNVELLADLLADLARLIHRHVDPLDAAGLAWRPDALGNSIGITVWHVSRWIDILSVVVLQARSHDEELWHAKGWAAKTGYDPRGVGFNGFGAITGYTAEEMNAVPVLARDDLLAYFDQTVNALEDSLRMMSDDSLQEPAPGSHQGLLAHYWIKAVLLGALGHAGEIEALAAMRSRQALAAARA